MSNQILRNKDVFCFGNQIVDDSGNTYLIEGDVLGRGGNGCVYKCTDITTGTDYAVKFLISSERKRTVRFNREIEFLKECGSHNNIIGYLDSGFVAGEAWTRGRKNRKKIKNDNIRFYLMELADGGSLKDFIAENKEISFRIYSGQLRGLAQALSHIHALGVLHRDIKPENILISGDRWMLSDFGLITSPSGISDLSGDSEKIGPVFWMSPEATNRCLGITGDEANISMLSDVFQLASVFLVCY
jgi:serine/threonine protein kinase